MKKVLFTLLVAMACVLTASAQEEVFVKGDKVAHAGFGIGSYLGGSGYTSTVPPVLISAEYGVTDALLNNGKGYVGVGGYMAYSANKYNAGSYNGADYGWKHSYIIIGARGAFHYQFVDKLDTYAGAMLGYNIASSSYFGNSGYNGASNSVGGVTYTSFVGARYYFTDKIAAFGEVGYGIAALELGVAVKF